MATVALGGKERSAPLGPVVIRGFQYGTSSYPAHLVLAEPASPTVDFAWMFYLVSVGDRHVLIDTGFVGASLVQAYRIQGYVRPDDLLAQAGVVPEAISDVILTHSHFDHVGAVHLFTDARIYLQRREFHHLMNSSRLGRAQEFLDQAKKDGRLRLLDGSHQLHPRIRVEPTGGHTRGSQAVFVEANGKRYVFVGDECYLLRACRTGSPLPAVSAADPDRNRKFLQRLRDMVNEGNTMALPFHDRAIMKAYGSGSSKVALIQ